MIKFGLGFMFACVLSAANKLSNNIKYVLPSYQQRTTPTQQQRPILRCRHRCMRVQRCTEHTRLTVRHNPV